MIKRRRQIRRQLSNNIFRKLWEITESQLKHSLYVDIYTDIVFITGMRPHDTLEEYLSQIKELDYFD